MRNIDKLAELLDKEFAAQGLTKESGFMGRAAAGLVRGGGAMFRGLASGAKTLAAPFRAVGGLASKVRAGYQGSMAAAPVRQEMKTMALQRGIGHQPSPANPTPRQSAPRSAAPASENLSKLKSMTALSPVRYAAPAPAAPQAAPASSKAVPLSSVAPLSQRMGTSSAPPPQVAAAGGPKKRWTPGAGTAMAGASLFAPGQNQQSNMSSGAHGLPIHLAEDAMKDLIEKIATEMPDATPEERAQVLASISMDAGFADLINAKIASYAPKQEKTAAATKKIAGRSVDFDKMTFDDVVAKLATRFGVSVNQAQIDEEEKTAAVKKTASQILMEKVQAELARPT